MINDEAEWNKTLLFLRWCESFSITTGITYGRMQSYDFMTLLPIMIFQTYLDDPRYSEFEVALGTIQRPNDC
jgi:hypothetical protein